MSLSTSEHLVIIWTILRPVDRQEQHGRPNRGLKIKFPLLLISKMGCSSLVDHFPHFTSPVSWINPRFISFSLYSVLRMNWGRRWTVLCLHWPNSGTALLYYARLLPLVIKLPDPASFLHLIIIGRTQKHSLVYQHLKQLYLQPLLKKTLIGHSMTIRI
jgi:hypothetical protein